MEIAPNYITVRQLVENYKDDNDGRVLAFNDNLVVRPSYQRNFVYDGKKRDAVIDTLWRGRPLNTMFWSVKEGGKFEVIDGQQRTISICQYIAYNEFSIDLGDGNPKYFDNLPSELKEKMLDYELMVYACNGSEEERLNWFKTINIAGEVLTKQELLNAVYDCDWLSDAKKRFSRNNSDAVIEAGYYMNKNAIRQEYLESAINWHSDGDIKGYMNSMKLSRIEHAKDLFAYFKNVFIWAESCFFPNDDIKQMSKEAKNALKAVEWGFLYNKYKDADIDKDKCREEFHKLIADDEVGCKSKIVNYIFTRKSNILNLRSFDPAIKRLKFKEQKGMCAFYTQKKGEKPHVFKSYSEMHADHILPWSLGGKTDHDNCQLLCPACNARKGGNY